MRRYQQGAFSGSGTYWYGARWSPPGVRVVYTSDSLALASMEFFVHLEEEDVVEPLVAIAAEIPAALRPDQLSVADLPPNWSEAEPPETLPGFGAKWVAEGHSAVLSVPSVLIPSERNYLLNPAHPDFARIKIRKPVPFGYDPRMLRKHRR